MTVLARKFEGPRGARIGEAGQVFRFVNRMFGFYTRFGLDAEYPWIYKRIARFPDQHRVILHRGEVVSHIGVYPLEFVTPGGRVLAGGIGAVCTAEKFQGKGLMTHLLGDVVKHMGKRGMPLSILWGNKFRYHRFGWEPAGSRFAFGFVPGSLPALKGFRRGRVAALTIGHVAQVGERTGQAAPPAR